MYIVGCALYIIGYGNYTGYPKSGIPNSKLDHLNIFYIYIYIYIYISYTGENENILSIFRTEAIGYCREL